MRSSSSPSSKRRTPSMEMEREKRKSSKGLKRFFKKLVTHIEKSVIFSAKVCYRNTREHPFVANFVLFVFLLYAFIPSLFWFLVSSSPVIVCTALLLGTLLSFGEPHIPGVEEDEMKTVHDSSPLQDRAVRYSIFVDKEEDEFSEKSTSESESEVEDRFPPSTLDTLEVGGPSEKVDSQEDEMSSSKSSLRLDREINYREREFGESRDIVGDILARVHSSKAHDQTESTLVGSSYLLDGVVEPKEDFFDKMHDQGGFMVAGEPPQLSENIARVSENARDIDAIGEVELEGFKPEVDMYYYTLLKPSEDQDDHSDFGSDKSESCSPDASISDINPMLDELCPFIPSNNVEDSELGIFNPTLQASMDDLVSESERSTQSPSSVYGSDELAENVEEGEDVLEDRDGEQVAWTLDDEKNVMDLGSSEVERNRRLENLMAKRRERKNTNPAELGLLLGLRNEGASSLGDQLSPLRVQVSSISTKRKNPFEDDSEGIGGLPPIPGSAPSILLGKSNPFDFPEKNFAEGGDIIGTDQREMNFEGFTAGSATSSGIREEDDANTTHHLAPEERVYHKYQRQLSELSYPKARSMFKSERLYPIPDTEYGRDLLALNPHERRDGEFVIEPESDHSWDKVTDETDALVFELPRISEVRDTSRAWPELEAESTDAIQYGSFTLLEAEVSVDGVDVGKVYHSDGDDKLGSPRLHSDETVVSDSSTESEKSSGSEHSGDEMLPASHPSVDDPIVLPSEVNILPSIADQIKASFRQEEEHAQYATDDSSDGYIKVADESQAEREGDFVEPSDIILEKDGVIHLAGNSNEVDERILSELDMVGDFSIEENADHDQVPKDIQSYDEAESQATTSQNLMGSDVHEVEDHTAKSFEDLRSAMQKHVEIATTSGLKDGDSSLQEIDARCYDDIDLALMHHAGISLDDVLVKDEHLEGPAHQSDIHEIEARSLDDIDLALMSHSGVLLNDGSVEDPLLEVSSHQSDFLELKARSLEDLREVLGGHEKLVDEDEDLDLHEIEAGSLAELREALGAEDLPKESVLIPLEQHEFEDEVVEGVPSSSEQQGVVPELHEIKASSFKDLHAAMFDSDNTSAPDELHHELDEAATHSSKDGLLEPEEDDGHSGSEMVTMESLEFGKEALSVGQEDRQSETITSDLHEIEVQSLEQLHTVFAEQDKHQDNVVSMPDVLESDAQSDAVNELQQAESQTPKGVHIVETQSDLLESEAHLEDGVKSSPIQQGQDASLEETLAIKHEAEADSVEALSSSPETEAQSVEDKDAISGHENSRVESAEVESHLHEVEAVCLEDLDKAIGQLHGKASMTIQSETDAQPIEDLHTVLVQETSLNGPPESNAVSGQEPVAEKLRELEPGALQPHNDG